MKWAITLVFVFVAFAGNRAVAQNATPLDRDIYIFDDEIIQGTVTSPNETVITVNRQRPQKSLIKIRDHFVYEILKDVENL